MTKVFLQKLISGSFSHGKYLKRYEYFLIKFTKKSYLCKQEKQLIDGNYGKRQTSDAGGNTTLG